MRFSFFLPPSTFNLVPSAFVLLACAGAGSAPSTPATAPPRAILVSFDAMNRDRALNTVSPDAIPVFRRFFEQASCADGARPMFPSLTAASHAAIWTGAYGNVNGVTANTMVPLPLAEFSLNETTSGFNARQLRAEPVWIAAARAGLRVVGHHVTQAPEPAGRFRPEGSRDTEASRRDSATLASADLFVLNGYNGPWYPARVITAESNPPHPASAWRNLERLGSTVPPREVSWAVGPDSLHAIFHGAGTYTGVIVSPVRDAASGVSVSLAPVEREAVPGRGLARHFSAALWLGPGRGTYFRLWELSPDLSRIMLLQGPVAEPRANHDGALRAYLEAVGPFIGNSESGLLNAGRFGPTITGGGDGTAELRYLETVELATRQFIQGSARSWRMQRPALLTDYYPIVDDLDHLWYGLVADGTPGVDAAAVRQLRAMRDRGWAIADRRLDGLLELARESGALFVLSGDHGMRATWRWFNVNTVLEQAGLLVVDDARRWADLGRTRAMSPNGYWVSANRVTRKDGIVADGSVDSVLAAAERALLSARDPEGRPIVTRVWRPMADDTLGIGGPGGGDLYFDLAPGYYYSSRYATEIVAEMPRPSGSHGFPSVDPDMQTVLCALGPGIRGRRLAAARVIDAAPTVSEWLGIPPPADARGRSLLGPMRSR